MREGVGRLQVASLSRGQGQLKGVGMAAGPWRTNFSMGYTGRKGQDPSRFTEAAEGRSELQYGDTISFLLLPLLDPHPQGSWRQLEIIQSSR